MNRSATALIVMSLLVLVSGVGIAACGPPPAGDQSESPAEAVSADAPDEAASTEKNAATEGGDDAASSDMDDSSEAGGESLALDGTVYGEGVSLTESLTVSEVFDRVDELEGQVVRVEGLVTDVCEMRGCWFEMAGDEGYQTLRFKVEDGVIVFPMSVKGRYAVGEGRVTKIEMDMEETIAQYEHHAMEHDEEFDPASVTEPLTTVRLDGIGAVIREDQ